MLLLPQSENQDISDISPRNETQDTTYHGVRIIGLDKVLVTNILKIIEKQESHNPEKTEHYEDHHYQATVQRALHLKYIFLSSVCETNQ